MVPTKPKDVVSFVGFMQYYSQFVLSFSELSVPLNQIKNKRKLNWTLELEKCFKGLKRAFRDVSGWKHLVLEKSIGRGSLRYVIVFLSKYTVAAVLHQTMDTKRRGS